MVQFQIGINTDICSTNTTQQQTVFSFSSHARYEVDYALIDRDCRFGKRWVTFCELCSAPLCVYSVRDDVKYEPLLCLKCPSRQLHTVHSFSSLNKLSLSLLKAAGLPGVPTFGGPSFTVSWQNPLIIVEVSDMRQKASDCYFLQAQSLRFVLGTAWRDGWWE